MRLRNLILSVGFAFIVAMVAVPPTAALADPPDSTAGESTVSPSDTATPPGPDRGEPGPAAIGTRTRVTIPNASLFQCPAAICNQGVANPTDTLSNICYFPGSTTPWGGQWNLVLNHANGHVGFISNLYLAAPLTTQSCTNAGRGVQVTIPTASLFQCPASFCNQGVANPGDDVADLCYLPESTTPWGGFWDLVLNHANNHVGFISSNFLTTPQNPASCAL